MWIRIACVLGLLLAASPAMAQMDLPNGRQRRGSALRDGPPPAKETRERLTPKPDPRQRLDAGALLCRSEADLAQHEAAIAARLDGQDVGEPIGCRRMRTMTPVSVLDRHGPARTQVRLPGPPEQLGWTDAVIRDP